MLMWLLGLVSLALEGAATWAFAQGALVSSLALPVAAAGALAQAYVRARALDEKSALATGWLWAAAFPVLGVGAGLVLLTLRQRGGRPSRLEESWQERRSHAAQRALEEKQAAQQVSHDVVPLVDALRAGDGALRISAMEAVRDRDSRPIVMMLSRERQNTLYDVRFRAVEHLGRINDQSLERIAAAEREVATQPSAEVHLKLARLCFDHAELGLDSKEVARGFLARAVVHAERAQALGHPNAATQVLLARVFWRLGALERAELELKRAHEIDPSSGDALLGLAELQFARKDFQGLRLTCATMLKRGVRLSKAQRDAVQFYSSWQPLDERDTIA